MTEAGAVRRSLWRRKEQQFVSAAHEVLANRPKAAKLAKVSGTATNEMNDG